MYGESASSAPKNEVGSLVSYKSIKGDIAVIRSGPAGNDDYEEAYTSQELSDAVEYYKTDDRENVFSEREKSRIMRLVGYKHGYGWSEAYACYLE